MGSIFSKFKSKFSNNKNNIKDTSDYAFSFEEISDLEKQNKEKIKILKKEVTKQKKNVDLVEKIEDNDISIIEKDSLIDEVVVTTDLDKIDKVDDSYINLSLERRNLIMSVWKNIDLLKLNKYIDKGKDILAHNYSITYGDDALAYIYKIRDEYDVLIEYMIGFNNEKKGIKNKVIFSNKLEEDWRYLSSYIKILEKIRGVKK